MRRYPRFALWAILALIGGVIAILDENVDFFEKHAPKINAYLHGGEITSTGDAIYDMNKWVADIGKLDADAKGKGWQAKRSDMLSRKPYLDDLVLQNDRLQRRLKMESDKHLDAGDPCESITIHEVAPLMARDTRLEQYFYSLLKDNESPTDEVRSRINGVSKTKDEINQGWSQFNEHWRSKGCK